jgi:multiple sugar transport system substrate-binding protein
MLYVLAKMAFFQWSRTIMARRFLPLIAVLLLISPLLAACGQSQSTGGGETITYWASNQGPSIAYDDQVLSQAVRDFKAQTGITVKFEVISWDALFNRILTADFSGENPDVLNIGNTWSATLQATRAFLPFDDVAMNAIGGRDRFLATSLAASGAPGQVPTSVPLYGLSYGLFYNKAMFNAAGIKNPPATWSEFIQDAQRLTNPKIGQWGVAVEGASITENAHWAFILSQQQGGSLFNQQNVPTFDSPQNVRAVQFYTDLISKYRVAGPQDAEYSTGTQSPADFANGKAAMIIFQTGTITALEADGMKPGQFGIAQVPVPDPLPPDGKAIESHVAGINISIFKDTQHKAAALQFVKFMTSRDEQIKLNKLYTSLPVVKDAYSDPAFQTPQMQTFETILARHAAPMPLIPQEGQMETVMGGAIKQLLSTAASTGHVSSSEIESQLSAANQNMKASMGIE